MRRRGTKTASVATRGVNAADHFANGFSKIAAAALVHVPAGFLATLYDVIYLLGVKPTF